MAEEADAAVGAGADLEAGDLGRPSQVDRNLDLVVEVGRDRVLLLGRRRARVLNRLRCMRTGKGKRISTRHPCVEGRSKQIGRTTWSDVIDLPSALNFVRATDFQMTSLVLGSYRLKTKLMEAGMSMMLRWAGRRGACQQAASLGSPLKKPWMRTR